MLIRGVLSVLEKYCYECHGQGGTDEGGFNFVLSLEKIAASERYVLPGDSENSPLIQKINSHEDPHVAVSLETEELGILEEWIDLGAPTLPGEERVFISNEAMMEVIHHDLVKTLTTDEERRDTRYLTLTHLYNAGWDEDELETTRLALNKMINSLSWNKNLIPLEPIDAEKTIFRLRLAILGWTPAIWNRILDVSPYRVLPDSSNVQACIEATDSQSPMIRGDWFITEAARPSLYYEILELPESLAGLEDLLEVSLLENHDQERVHRAGFAKSGIAANNRVIERHPSRFGAFWISYDFADNEERRNIFEHPLGPGPAVENFRPDGGEILFELPNGLHAYMLVDDLGQRVDKAPLELVQDENQPDHHVVAAISCFSCHSLGILAKEDEVRATVLADPERFEQRDHLLSIYTDREEFRKIQEEDAKNYAKRIQQLGIRRVSHSSEPIRNQLQRYQQDLDLNRAAAELGVDSAQLADWIQSDADETNALSPLANPKGTVSRDDFLNEFTRIATALGLGVEIGAERVEPLKTAEIESQLGRTRPVSTPGRLEPLDEEGDGNPNPPAQQPPAKRPSKSKSDASEPKPPAQRFWKDHSGKVLSIGDFLRMENQDTVVIKDANNRELRVLLNDLSPADGEFVQSQIQATPKTVGSPQPELRRQPVERSQFPTKERPATRQEVVPEIPRTFPPRVAPPSPRRSQTTFQPSRPVVPSPPPPRRIVVPDDLSKRFGIPRGAIIDENRLRQILANKRGPSL
ncbi:MAG: hypothetical protein KDA80_09035 [Planctomycetaceae bacterium]|nr:hypothetical protein [Planctomycetaceae bacterium]